MVGFSARTSIRAGAYVVNAPAPTLRNTLDNYLADAEIGTNTERFWELDYLRGAAIISMVVIHASTFVPLLANFLIVGHLMAALTTAAFFGYVLYAASQFDGWNIQFNSDEWAWLARLILWGTFIGVGIYKTGIGAFICLLGMGMVIRQQRGKGDAASFAKRAFALIALGFAVVGVNLLFGNYTIIWSTLSHLGLSMLISIPFLKIDLKWVLAIASSAIAIGLVINGIASSSAVLSIISFKIVNGALLGSWLDFSPMLPWTGHMLMGVAAGRILFKDGKRRYVMPPKPKDKLTKWIDKAGKNSLWVYLAHYPLLVFGQTS